VDAKLVRFREIIQGVRPLNKSCSSMCRAGNGGALTDYVYKFPDLTRVVSIVCRQWVDAKVRQLLMGPEPSVVSFIMDLIANVSKQESSCSLGSQPRAMNAYTLFYMSGHEGCVVVRVRVRV